MFIWYTAQFEFKRKSYPFGDLARPGLSLCCFMVPGTIDPLRDWEFDL
jgi:hypothetical protein